MWREISEYVWSSLMFLEQVILNVIICVLSST